MLSTTFIKKLGLTYTVFFCLTVIAVQNAHADDDDGCEGLEASAVISVCPNSTSADPNISGFATLCEEVTSEGIKQVSIEMIVNGLSEGKHGVHIHETANCDPCSAAGGHHDPGHSGVTTPDAPDYNHPFHMGDLINIKVNNNGRGVLRTTTNRITLSPGRLSIFDDDGSAFIIHTFEDTFCDHEDELNPGCAGGPRDACGVIVLNIDDDD